MFGGMAPQIVPTPAQFAPQQTMLVEGTLKNSSLISYNCMFLEQFQGMYEMATDNGPHRIRVLMPIRIHELYNQAFTIVRRVGVYGENLSDQIIVEDSVRFTLCSIDYKVLAHMTKGADMKNGII